MRRFRKLSHLTPCGVRWDKRMFLKKRAPLGAPIEHLPIGYWRGDKLWGSGPIFELKYQPGKFLFKKNLKIVPPCPTLPYITYQEIKNWSRKSRVMGLKRMRFFVRHLKKFDFPIPILTTCLQSVIAPKRINRFWCGWWQSLAFLKLYYATQKKRKFLYP